MINAPGEVLNRKRKTRKPLDDDWWCVPLMLLILAAAVASGVLIIRANVRSERERCEQLIKITGGKIIVCNVGATVDLRTTNGRYECSSDGELACLLVGGAGQAEELTR